MSKLLIFRAKAKDVGRCMVCDRYDKDKKVLVVSVGKLAVRLCENCKEKLTQLLIDLERNSGGQNEKT